MPYNLSIDKKIFFPVALTLFFLMMTGCNNADYVPKPAGYLRLDMPEHSYSKLDSIFPFTFEYSEHAKISADKVTRQNPNWFNIHYPAFRANIHMSYKSLENTRLYNLQRDAHEMAYKHAPKAVGIREIQISHPARDIYGLAYDIDGKEAASSFQFYLTDSTEHFIRGALYFNLKPDNDSLSPIIDFIVEDIDHMISTFRWQ